MDFALARTNMVKSQIIPNQIFNPDLLGGMMEISRESFVATNIQNFAYSDLSLLLTEPQEATGRRMLKPLQAGSLIQSLELVAGNRVLVVGAGTGYEAALLAYMGMSVFALENNTTLSNKGQKLLADQKIIWRTGNLADGWPEEAPFDGILFCGAIHAVPNNAVGQLGSSGRLVAIVGDKISPLMRAVRIKGISGADRPDILFETSANFLPSLEPPQSFKL
ncbi:MAG: hypothetical protein H7832_01725 [Magnetococcus sp. DMHC-6]